MFSFNWLVIIYRGWGRGWSFEIGRPRSIGRSCVQFSWTSYVYDLFLRYSWLLNRRRGRLQIFGFFFQLLNPKTCQDRPPSLFIIFWFISWASFTFFSAWVFLTDIHDSQGSWGRWGYFFNLPLYHFHQLQHLNISRAITAGSSPPRTAISQNRAGNLWFPSASC